MLEQRQLAIYRRAGHLRASVKLVPFDVGRRDLRQMPFGTKELLQGLKQLLVSQSGTLVGLRIFHVTLCKMPQAYSYGLTINAPQDFRSSKCMESFRVAPDRAMRRLLDSPSLLIVIANPPVFFGRFPFAALFPSLCQPRAHCSKWHASPNLRFEAWLSHFIHHDLVPFERRRLDGFLDFVRVGYNRKVRVVYHASDQILLSAWLIVEPPFFPLGNTKSMQEGASFVSAFALSRFLSVAHRA